MTKAKGDLALAVGIDIVAFDRHGGIVMEQTFHHRGNLGGKGVFELRVNAGGFFIHVPVNFDPSGAMPGMPIGHQILIPCPKQFGVRGTRGGSLTPNLR